MSTRSSRRSAAGGATGSTLNPSIIPLLPASRLKSELTSRGLNATGPQHVLADRLVEAVELERMGCSATTKVEETAAAVVDVKPKTPAKSPVKAEKKPVEEKTPKAQKKEPKKVAKSKRDSSAVEAEPATFMEPKAPETPKEEPKSPVEEKMPKAQKKELKKVAKSKRDSSAVEAEPAAFMEPAAPETAKEESKSPSKAENKLVEEKMPTAQKEFKKVVKREQDSSAVEADPAAVMEPEVPETPKEDPKSPVRTDKKPVEENTLKAQKKDSKAVKRKRDSSAMEAEAAVVPKIKIKIGADRVPVPQRKNSKECTSKQVVSEEPKEVQKKKSIVLPSRALPTKVRSLDIFDTILDKQSKMLASKFKTNEEKQAELRNIELSKRRFSTAGSSSSNAAPGSVDKRQALSIDVSFNTPSAPSTPLSSDSASIRNFRFNEGSDKNDTPSPVVRPKSPKVQKIEPKAEATGQEYSRLPSPPRPPCDLLPPPPPPPIFGAEEPMDTSEPLPIVGEIVTEAVTPEQEEQRPPSHASNGSAKEAPMEGDKEVSKESPEPYVPEEPPAAAPAFSSDLLKSVASILQNLYSKQKEVTPPKVDEDEQIKKDVKEVVEGLLDRLGKLEQDDEIMEIEEGKENDVSRIIDPALLKDPRELMKRASDVLTSLSSKAAVKEEIIEYAQEFPEPGEVSEPEDDLPKELEFHGEPVPESDEEDGDALFAAAAGLPHKKAEKKKTVVVDEDEPVGDAAFELDYFNADLNVKASTEDKHVVDPDVSDGFALMYGGVKTNYGFAIKERAAHAPASRYAYQIKILEFLSIRHVPFEEVTPHDVRVGWSVDSGKSFMHVLGEAANSYAFDMQGRKILNSQFSEYGELLDVGDVVTTVLDLNNRTIEYYKNDSYLGVSFADFDLPTGLAIFPHIATKNCKVAVNFGWKLEGDTELWRQLIWRACLAGVKTLLNGRRDRLALERANQGRRTVVRSLVAPESKEHCTVLMMVGLPAVGKTTWVRKYLRDHPEEHWILISTDAVSNAMTVNGVPRRRVHRGRWDMVMGLIAKAVTRSLHMACRRKHNYIIDQTNVSRDTRRRRLTQFKDFQRKCVVLIPSDEDFNRRQQRQARMEGTGTVPPEAMLELKAVMSIPNSDQEPIEDVVFIEPPVERIMDAIKIVNVYNEEAKPWYQKKYQRGRRGGGSYGSYGDRRRDKDDDYHRPPPQKVVITQHMRTNNITSKPRYEQS
ncbi:hypothetical protein L596_022078 [Steinernema carpocapsae]|uniref:B30.2/SPRY domain-containing protein n=1 Tax=Steinernema carpocapsae TaxID=34508 RepID=A0A4U5MKP8_STECR|nr:hypothetical protein L596_022078 [Steinernema carpocapsae]